MRNPSLHSKSDDDGDFRFGLLDFEIWNPLKKSWRNLVIMDCWAF
jgi:hypothetical protein